MSISDEEFDDGIKEMAESFNQPAEEIKKFYDENKDKVEFFKHSLLEKKAINLIIDNSKIEDVEPESAEEDAKSE